MSLYGNIQTAFDGVGDTIQDIVSVDVVTLTGTIDIKSCFEGEHIQLKKIYETIEKNAKGESDIEVVAFTHVDLDADSLNFVKKNLSLAETALVEAHNEAVITAQETRAGIIEMAKSFISR